MIARFNRTSMLILLHLLANALLLWLAYLWLGVGESTMFRLALSAADALVILALVCWLHGATFAYFRTGAPRGVNAAFRTALRHLPALLLLAVAVIVLYLLLAMWDAYSAQPAFKWASYLTLKLRRPVKPAAILAVFRAVLWVVRWVLLPLALLPMFSGVAARGWSGFGEFGWPWKRLIWLAAPVSLLCALWAPFRLYDWVPHVNGFGLEMLSFALRVALAYLMFVAGWLILAFVTSRGRPAASQLNTATSP
jgi:hypothetical protein